MRKCVDHKTVVLVLVFLAIIPLFFINIVCGSVDIPFDAVCHILCGEETVSDVWRAIVVDTRLPQAVTAILAGSAISVCGLLLQTLFANPLAGPEVLGINSGAGLGVAVVMLLFNGVLSTIVSGVAGHAAILAGALSGALAVMAVVLMLSAVLRDKVFLLIAGVAVSYLISSVISVLNFMATSEGVHSFIVWGMGSFSAVSWEQMPLFAIATGVLLIVALLLMKPLNILLLGDNYAHNLGVNVRVVRAVLLFVTGCLTAVVTAFCGPISFIGLAVPHLARLVLSTADHRLILPATMMLGGGVALICNLVCNMPGDSGMLPLGAVTPLVGAPVIIYVILRDRSLRM